MQRRHLPSITAMAVASRRSRRHLSFTRAADELALTQSAVSKQVAQLEDLLQHSLFRRVRRRLQLTPAGALYLAEVDKILNQLEMSARYLRSYGGETEVLRVATPPTFGERWLVPRLKGWRLRFPNIHLDVSSALEPVDFRDPRHDVALFYGHGSWPGAECELLLHEHMVAVCAPDLLPTEGIAGPEQLVDFVLLQNTTRPVSWHDWYASLGREEVHSHHGPRFDTFTLCARAAQEGCGVRCCRNSWWPKNWPPAVWCSPGRTAWPAPTPTGWPIRNRWPRCPRCAASSNGFARRRNAWANRGHGSLLQREARRCIAILPGLMPARITPSPFGEEWVRARPCHEV